MQKTAILSILVVISLALLVVTITRTVNNNEQVTGAECWDRFLLGQDCTNNIISVHLEDGLIMTDSIETKIPHPLIGKVVFSEDETTCWKIEEMVNVFYYKMMSECPNA